MVRFRCMMSLALWSVAARGQAPDSRPAFDMADVHPSAAASFRTLNAPMQGGMQRGGRYQLRRATMVDLIRTAYGVEAQNVVGGPSWLETDRFEIIAKAAPGTQQENINLMLQRLLAERFGLAVHNETRRVEGLVLSAGKGKPKLKESEGSGPGGCQPDFRPPEPGGIPRLTVVCHGMSMAAFATSIRQFVPGYLTAAVVDSTGIKGTYDFTLTWTPPGISGGGEQGVSIFDAVDRQLGLKLETEKVPTAVIVVDRVNQKPTPNPPGVTTANLPAAPTEFEVADIKPSAPGAPGRGGGFQPGGRIDLRGFPLRMLISVAFDIPQDAEIPGAPKFIDTVNFDLVAKATTNVSTAGNGPPIDVDDLRLMLRNLLADRFKLKTHYEDRPVTAYTLLAVKPKLKPADPSNRSSCKLGFGPAANGAPGPPQVVCQNVTMAQFAEQLQRLAPLYIRYPVENATELEGAFDFSFAFSQIPPNLLATAGGGGRMGPGGGPPPAASPAENAPSAAEPTAVMSLFDAVSKQLGLKLEARKRPLPVLVIDHIEEKPTEN